MNADEFGFVRDMVQTRAGILLDDDMAYLVEKRAASVAQQFDLPSASELLTQVQADADSPLSHALIEALTTNETSFFRDLHPFLALQNHIVPDLLSRRSGQRSLRILSAGCSTGQEVFSISMTLDQHFPELASWDVEVLGVDLSKAMIERCNEGSYNQLEVQRGLPAQKLLRYFTQDGLAFRIAPAIRERTRFCHMNVVEAWPFTQPFDIIFLRNVLIYFSRDGQRAALQNVRENLAPDGYLLLGVENAVELDGNFQHETIGKASVYRLRPEETP